MVFKDQRKGFEKLYSQYSSNPPWNYKAIYIDVLAMINEPKFFNLKSRILDLGCGNGRFSVLLNQNKLSVYSLDFSLNALKFAKNNYNLTKLTVGDALRLPFKDASFDSIIDVGLLHCIYPEKRILVKQEIMRVLKRGGSYLLSEICRDDKTLYSEPLFYAFVKKIGKTIRKVIGQQQIPTWGLSLDDIKMLFGSDFLIVKFFYHNNRLIALLKKKEG